MGEERTAVRCPTHTNCVAILTTVPSDDVVGRVPPAISREYAAMAWLHAIEGNVIDVVHESPAVPGLSLIVYLQVPGDVRALLVRAAAGIDALVDEARALAERITELRAWTADAFDDLQREEARPEPRTPAIPERVRERTEAGREPVAWAPPIERSDVLVMSAAGSPSASALEPAGSANAPPRDHRSSTPFDLPV